MGPVKQAIIDLVNQVPRGYVVSYGQLAPLVSSMTGKNISAQMVGWQLSGMPEHQRSLLPWWRVVNKQGIISAMKLGTKGWKQKQLLEKDGVDLEGNSVVLIETIRRRFSESSAC